jgi:tetratricopeptide (TPR) repeat protein
MGALRVSSLRPGCSWSTTLSTGPDALPAGTGGEYQKGIAVMDEAVRAQDRPGVATPELADALGELANHHFYAGHYDISDALNQRVLAIDRQLYGPAHPKVAEELINPGAAQHDRGHYVEAEKYHRQALAIYEKFYGGDHPQTASALTLVGRALVCQRRYDEAESLLRRAVAIQERVHGPVHPRWHRPSMNWATSLRGANAIPKRRRRSSGFWTFTAPCITTIIT